MKKNSDLKIIETIEKIKVSNGKKNKKVFSRIDTGAKMSSMDIKLAKQLGFNDLIKDFYKKDLSKYKPNSSNRDKIEKEIFESFSHEMPNLKGVSVVFSSSGITIRPVVEFEIVIAGNRIKSKANITDRSKMKYPMIIGRKDLENFLIKV